MEKEPYFGIASPEATERAFQRWFAFMLFPGFGWVGLAGFFVLPFWVAALLAYITVYAAFAFAWPGTFAGFWRELGKAAPGALRDAALSLVRLAIWIALRVRDFFAGAAGALASIGAPLVAAMNIAYHERKRPKAASRDEAAVHHRLVGVGIEPEGPEAEEPRASEQVAPRRSRIDWGKLAAALVNPRFWAFVLICLALIALARCADGINPFKPASGREVAAEARADVEKARARTNAAEAGQRENAIVRVEQLNSEVAAIEHETEQVREAIVAAPDLEARIAVHRSYDQRMRDAFARARAAAVSDYRSGLGS